MSSVTEELSLIERIAGTLKRMPNHDSFSVERRDLEEILDALCSSTPRTEDAELADDVRHIAAHEPDPCKAEKLYEVADILEWKRS